MTNNSVSKTKKEQLYKLLNQLNINMTDIKKTYITGSGKGGQKQNKTQNCVQIHHIPTQITIKCQETRSKDVNEYKAFSRLAEQIAAKYGIETKQSKKIAALKKQKARRKRKSQQKHQSGENNS